MKKTYQRLLTFFIGVPLIVCVVIFLPFLHHLALSILIIAATVIGAAETASLFKQRGISHDFILPIICSAIFPLGAYLEIAGIVETAISRLALPLVLWIILLAGLFGQSNEKIQTALSRTGSNLFIAVYPGVLAAFLVKIAGFEQSELALLIFVVAVFLNDSMAYVFGMLFGRNNRGIFPASNKKSVAGLISGLAFSIGGTVVFFHFYPGFFGSSFVLAVVVGGAVGLAGVAGDLIESTLKRSAGVKDSGRIIPGRGGMLDSIDSVVFAAPVFFLLIRYFA